MSDYSEALAEKICTLVGSYGHVSFVDFERHLPEVIGSIQMVWSHPNLVLWNDLTGEFIDTLSRLVEQKRVHMWPAPGSMVYVLDGKWIALPEAKSVRAYKKPRWMPVTFHHRAPTLQDFGGKLAA